MTNIPVSTQWLHNSAPVYAQHVIDAVAMIVVQATGGKGTGWLVSPRMMVTNEHVIRGGAPASTKVQFPDGQVLDVSRFVAVDPVADLAVIELQADSQANPLKLDTSGFGLGDQVYALGFPLAYNGPAPLMTVGYVAGFEERAPHAGANPLQRVVLNAALNPGNSGGPVFAWGGSSVRGVAVSKHAPITLGLQSAIAALANNSSGICFSGTDAQGNPRTFVESQLVAEVLTYFRSMTQVVIGEAITSSDVEAFLSANNVLTPDGGL